MLATMQRVFRCVQLFEDPFITRQREQFGIEQKEIGMQRNVLLRKQRAA